MPLDLDVHDMDDIEEDEEDDDVEEEEDDDDTDDTDADDEEDAAADEGDVDKGMPATEIGGTLKGPNTQTQRQIQVKQQMVQRAQETRPTTEILTTLPCG